MELPLICRENLNTLTEHAELSALRQCVRRMTENYRTESGKGSVLVRTGDEVLAYAAVRMPATFGAVSSALKQTLSCLSAETHDGIRTVLDLGAGTGAGAWAVSVPFPEAEITCVERETEMIRIGKALRENAAGTVQWEQADALSAVRRYAESGKTFDLVLASYMTNELSDADRERLTADLWRITGKVLLIIEPGTVVGASILRNIRTVLLSHGARIAAPCPCSGICPLPETDWCHFAVRIARSRLHKLLKGGDVPYEDEKFSYLACTKDTPIPCGTRILRHPMKESGRISLSPAPRKASCPVPLQNGKKKHFPMHGKRIGETHSRCTKKFENFSKKRELFSGNRV